MINLIKRKQPQENQKIELLAFEFFKQIVKKYKRSSCNYDYIVLTTRRCFCLYYAWKNNYKINISNSLWYLINYRYVREIEKRIISSQSVDIIGKDFLGSSVLLADDIMIHGKTMYDYYNKVLNYGAKNIDTIVLIRNIERPDYYYNQTKKEYTSVYNKINWDWKTISNNIVSFLHNVGQLYVSYIYGFVVDEDCLVNALNSNNLVKCEENFSEYIKHPVYKDGEQPQYYFYPEFDKYKFIECAFLRVYPIRRDSRVMYKVIPYVELSDFDCDNLGKIWLNIWSNGLPKEFKTIKKSEDIYKALSAILSYKLCEILFDNNAKIDNKEIDKSFVSNFLSIVQTNIKEDLLSVLENDYVLTRLKNINSTLMEKELDRLNLEWTTSIGDSIETIKQYFYRITTKEEKIFEEYNINGKVVYESQNLETLAQIKEFQTPIATSIFYQYLVNDKKIECIGFLLYLLDNGVASHVVKTFDNGRIVATAIKAGEQSYHLFSDLSGIALRTIYYLLKHLKKIKDKNLVANLKGEFLKKLEEIGVSNISSIKCILDDTPMNLRADFFGIINLRKERLTLNDIEDEKKYAKVLFEVLKNI